MPEKSKENELRIVAGVVGLVFATALFTAGASELPYPSRPIRIITGEPGGDSDFAARLIAQGMIGAVGQPVVIDNRPSSLSAVIASKALPDGYTLLVTG